MLGKTDKTPQLNIYQVPLIQFIDKSHELCQAAERIDWDSLERDLSEYYCVDNGRPSIPIRKIVGVILLKRSIRPSKYTPNLISGHTERSRFWGSRLGSLLTG